MEIFALVYAFAKTPLSISSLLDRGAVQHYESIVVIVIKCT